MMNFKLPISETAPRFFETDVEPPETQHQGHVSCQRTELAKTPSSSKLLCVPGTGHCPPRAHRASVPRASPNSAACRDTEPPRDTCGDISLLEGMAHTARQGSSHPRDVPTWHRECGLI